MAKKQKVEKIKGLSPDLAVIDEFVNVVVSEPVVEPIEVPVVDIIVEPIEVPVDISIIESSEDEAIIYDDIIPVETTEIVFTDVDVVATEDDFIVASTKQPFPKLKQVSEGGLTFYEIE